MENIVIVVPVYNEEENIVLLFEDIKKYLENEHFSCYFIDDGSNDNTLINIKNMASQDERIHFISFTRNFGHQYALKAGIDYTDGDCLITMDGDMQHPPELLPLLIQKWREGYSIVQTVRNDAQSTGDFKTFTSKLFYRFINFLTPIHIKKGAADFRLLDKKVVDYCRQLQETSYFWRGIIPWTGFSSIDIKYTTHPRAHGTSKYTLRKMFRLAADGIFSFSLIPLRLCIGTGIFSMFLGLLYLCYVLLTLVLGNPVIGWASIVSSILFFAGVQLIFLGIIGEYVGRIFIASKKRPDYIINEQK